MKKTSLDTADATTFPAQDWTQLQAGQPVLVQPPDQKPFTAAVDMKTSSSSAIWTLRDDPLRTRQVFAHNEGVRILPLEPALAKSGPSRDAARHLPQRKGAHMADIVIRSDEANAAITAMVLAARGHSVCLLTTKLSPGLHDFDYFGEQRTVTLHGPDDFGNGVPRVGIVFAEGEDVGAGVSSVLSTSVPDLLVIIGGGIAGAVAATEAAQNHGLDLSRILLVGAFLVGGDGACVTAEKQEVLAGFITPGAPADVVELAVSTLPQISIGDGFDVALSSVNAMFHVPPMILNAMSVERGDDVRFYVEGFGDSVCRLLLELDADRLRLGAALGLTLAPIEELNDRYSDPAELHEGSFREKVNTPLSTKSVKLPSSFHHRYLAHELRSSFAPMYELGQALNIDVPAIQAVTTIGEILVGAKLREDARLVSRKFLDLLNAPVVSAG